MTILTHDKKYDLQNANHINDTSLLDEPLMDRKAAAKFLGLKNPNTLAVWDCTKRYDLRPYKVGRAVRYSRTNLVRFLNEQLKAK